MQPITLYSHHRGPNPWKVAIIFEELNIPYKTRHIDFSEVKKDPYLKLNPNGRLPTIDDPNTGLQIWESGAIVEYLIETYDKDHRLSYNTFPEQWQLKQWLFFQVSGQAPYYGQARLGGSFEPIRRRFKASLIDTSTRSTELPEFSNQC